MNSIILGITGASGASFGLSALKILTESESYTVHMIVSPWAHKVILEETGSSLESHLKFFSELSDIRDKVIIHQHDDLSASVSSGSFPTLGMLIAPCSMSTLCGIAAGLSGNLIERTAAVTLKERRPLVLLARETPLSTIHLEQMHKLSLAGGIIMPPVPAFYNKPKTIEDIVNDTTSRALRLLGVINPDFTGWKTNEAN